MVRGFGGALVQGFGFGEKIGRSHPLSESPPMKYPKRSQNKYPKFP